MNRINQIVALVIGTLGCLNIGVVASADQSVGGKQILNRSGSEVGDFGGGQTGNETNNGKNTYSGVIQPIGQISDLDTRNGQAKELFRKGVLRQMNNDLAGAIEQYRMSLSLYDSDPTVHHYLGNALKASRDEKEAQVQFSREQELKKAFQLFQSKVQKKSIETTPVGEITPRPHLKGF